MATNNDDAIAIRTRFAGLWPSGTKVLLDNDPNIEKPKAIYARLSIQPGAQFPLSVFPRTYEQLGRIYLQIFIPAQLGLNGGWELAETFTTMFRDWASPDGRMRCLTPEFRVSDAEKDVFLILCLIQYRARH